MPPASGPAGSGTGDRGAVFDAARHALDLHRWLREPGFDQEGEIPRADAALAAADGQGKPLLAAASWLHEWLENGGARAPARAAPG